MVLGSQSPSAKLVLVVAVRDALIVLNPSDQGEFGSASLKAGNPFVEEEAVLVVVRIESPSAKEVLVGAVRDAVAVVNSSDQVEFDSASQKAGNPSGKEA